MSLSRLPTMQANVERSHTDERLHRALQRTTAGLHARSGGRTRARAQERGAAGASTLADSWKDTRAAEPRPRVPPLTADSGPPPGQRRSGSGPSCARGRPALSSFLLITIRGHFLATCWPKTGRPGMCATALEVHPLKLFENIHSAFLAPPFLASAWFLTLAVKYCQI